MKKNYFQLLPLLPKYSDQSLELMEIGGNRF